MKLGSVAARSPCAETGYHIKSGRRPVPDTMRLLRHRCRAVRCADFRYKTTQMLGGAVRGMPGQEKPANDDTFSTAPRPRSTIPGRNLLHRSTTAATSTSTRLSCCSGTDFATGACRQARVVDQDVRLRPIPRRGRQRGAIGTAGRSAVSTCAAGLEASASS